MTTSNADLAVKIENLEGKINLVHSSMIDLKTSFDRIADLAQSVGKMEGETRSLNNDVNRLAEAQREMKRELAEVQAYKNWTRGGLAVVAFLITILGGAMVWALTHIYDADVKNAFQEQAIVQIQRKLLIDSAK